MPKAKFQGLGAGDPRQQLLGKGPTVPCTGGRVDSSEVTTHLCRRSREIFRDRLLCHMATQQHAPLSTHREGSLTDRLVF